MKQLNDLKVSKKSAGKRSADMMNPEASMDSDDDGDGEDGDDCEDDDEDYRKAMAMFDGGNDDEKMHGEGDLDGQSASGGHDMFSELLASETFSDFKEYLIDEALLVAAYPDASIERIQVERQYQASHYVMKKFLHITENKDEDRSITVLD